VSRGVRWCPCRNLSTLPPWQLAAPALEVTSLQGEVMGRRHWCWMSPTPSVVEAATACMVSAVDLEPLRRDLHTSMAYRDRDTVPVDQVGRLSHGLSEPTQDWEVQELFTSQNSSRGEKLASLLTSVLQSLRMHVDPDKCTPSRLQQPRSKDPSSSQRATSLPLITVANIGLLSSSFPPPDLLAHAE
jgi:hypothetical protein